MTQDMIEAQRPVGLEVYQYKLKHVLGTQRWGVFSDSSLTVIERCIITADHNLLLFLSPFLCGISGTLELALMTCILHMSISGVFQHGKVGLPALYRRCKKKKIQKKSGAHDQARENCVHTAT